MIIYGALIIPIVVIVFLMVFFRREVTWWEYAATIGIPAVFILIFKLSIEKLQTSDTEYWGSWITQSQYFEDWDEEVPCRHPIPCSHTKYCTDSKGRSYACGTEHSNDGYYHLYDVDYHPPYWIINGSGGEEFSISQAEFERLAKKFENRTFVDLHRSYHSKDGDKYITLYDNSDARLETITTVHTYENRVKAANSVFNFPEVTEEQKKIYHLYDYPKPVGFRCMPILGEVPGCTTCANWKLDFWNGRLGKSKEVRMWILMYKNLPKDAGLLQEAYWKGGNKNEFILTIGVDSTYRVKWVHPISWTTAASLKIEARNFISSMDTLDMDKTVDWLGHNIQEKFERKHFREFSYLDVDPPDWAIIVTYFVTLLITIGWALFSVRNDSKPV